ncbi:hypothetical protein HFO56_02230 [Rhizobium laguerreae]|uniref:hypothetical protein n=1 Tax=Rhizobium laguerreae TaxID=1076926 RepID=UPI001C92ACB6|nr:hypothetical protein [Rhizobium laguerreae]MBY3151218.1 hypothetical protein [Rhizobium laguerreae]
MEKAVNDVTKLIRGIIALGVIAAAGALIAFNPIASGVVGGFVANSNLQARAVDEVNERNFQTACVVYKEASTWQRWTTPMGWSDSWCEDYLHRM